MLLPSLYPYHVSAECHTHFIDESKHALLQASYRLSKVTESEQKEMS